MSEPAVPSLDFHVRGIAPMAHAAVPTLVLTVAVVAGAPVRALVLRVEIRVALGRRGHDAATRARLAEIFGQPAQWAAAPRALAWLDVTVNVPAFEAATTVELALPCTHDFDIAATKYFHGLADGVIPLDLLFSGSVFYTGDDHALRTARLSWDRQAACELPLATWRQLSARYFADSVWLRLDRNAFDRLWAYRTRHALPSWEAALDALLGHSPAPGARAPYRSPEAKQWTR